MPGLPSVRRLNCGIANAQSAEKKLKHLILPIAKKLFTAKLATTPRWRKTLTLSVGLLI